MPNPLDITIAGPPNYAVSPPNASTDKTHGVKFIPPSGGCTICVTTGKIDGKTSINLTQDTTYHGNQLETGQIVYNTYGPNTDCSNPPRRPTATVGNTIDVGSGMPR